MIALDDLASSRATSSGNEVGNTEGQESGSDFDEMELTRRPPVCM
ncbi:hypothetical protein PPTG_22834 [Phytophthora nicotianae INRA-310]|uniref:Uncharacterized protein n=1 Tax=Phytophthora nicotianae (strain INRA-310) TaxID=761204 RepID=W2QAE7_PHYN3|nr:hypothetical protein PPTG_22834 [Phytophthora nicotianae INRA-310]ETN09811.1 hypothetical protein PPTG_22834 [Phytophthora nicotianae INRA-310]